MLRPGRKWLTAFLVAVLLTLPGVSWGGGFGYGGFNGELGLRFGYGKSTSKASVHLFSFLPRWGVFLVRPGAYPSMGGLALSFVLEGIISAAQAEGDGAEIGITPMLKVGLPLGTRAMLFLEGGAGIISESFDSPAVAHSFNFTPQIGGGLDVALTSRLAFTAAYRFRHSSNAGIYKENPAFNVNFVHAGFSYFY